jgi:phosphatidylglycerol:prolipoprotein diacylglycerol transferase
MIWQPDKNLREYYMHPELFTIPWLNLPVHTYGAMYVSGLLLGMFVAFRQAKLDHKYHNDILDFGFYALLGALIGARILFIIVEADYYFIEHPFTVIPKIGIAIPTIFAVWKGGFVFWGGAVGGAIALILFCRKRNIPLGQMADYCAPGLAIGHAIGRIGCIAGGCCYGYATYHLDQAGKVLADFPFALAYPEGSIAYGALIDSSKGQTLELMQRLGTTLPLFPVQILESVGNLVIFFTLMLLIPYKRVHGQIAVVYLILYSILRSIAEIFRGDAARRFVIDNILSTSQFISILVIITSLFLIIFLSKRQHPKQL